MSDFLSDVDDIIFSLSSKILNSYFNTSSFLLVLKLKYKFSSIGVPEVI